MILKFSTKLITIASAISLATACASKSPYFSYNERLINEKQPIRLVKDEAHSQIDSVKYVEDWAGKKGKSVFSEAYSASLFTIIKNNCGYGKGDLIEQRIVNHSKTEWEEVWIFNDERSYRTDGTSGLTVFVQYDPKTNRNQTDFFGDCHTGRGVSFVENY